MQKERILYIDRLRGINIFLVVLGHIVTNNVIQGEYSGVYVWGSTFRMPLFMFLCGYIAAKVIKPKIFKNYGGFILKKCRTLLIPFFVWPLLVSNFFFTAKEDYHFLDTMSVLINGGGRWFLLHLFYITILYSFWLYISSKINSKNKFWLDTIISGLVLSILAVLLYFDVSPMIRPLIMFYIFYFAGVFVSKYDMFSNILMKREVFSVALLVFISLVGFYIYADSTIYNILIKVICAIAAIAVFYFTIRTIKWPPLIDKYVRFWGVNSLIIYVTHFHIIRIFENPFIPEGVNPFILLVFTALLAIIACLITMTIYSFIKMSPVLNFLLYGSKLNLPFSKKEATLNT